GFSETAPVGSFPQGVSLYGVQDMAGNVFEWVADWYDRYYYYALPDGVENPTGPDDQSVSGGFRVLRGGSWDVFGIIVHTTYRSHKVATTTVADYGFRCARTP
ncbi:MAG TPA: SUMF1/EgtB/PvdO family nonheme iron enzyme, partial [Anaerolineales bacterium]|nr:SUMF1/EgtB/PvdO family nonheme iron enzyme [Anaerolineales bacterium]